MSRIHLPITSNQNHYVQLSWSCMIESSQFKRASCGVTVRRVPYRHCIIRISSHKIKLWEEPAPSLATTPTHKLANNTDSIQFQLTPIPSLSSQIQSNNDNLKRILEIDKKELIKLNPKRKYILGFWGETPGPFKGNARRR